MLTDLDQIDWKAIGEPRVPEWLTGLMRGEMDTWQQVEYRFTDLGSDSPENYGPLSELLKNDSPILMTPFLINLLTSPECKSKVVILELLLDFANYLDLALKTPFPGPKRTRAELDNISQISPKDDIHTLRAKKVFIAVREGIEIYKSLLHHHGPSVGMGAAYLLEFLSELD
jgi:hypothetical protein